MERKCASVLNTGGPPEREPETKGEIDVTFALSAADVFEAAILLEERGARFYADAAARCTGEAKKLLSGLSSMEKNHAERFRSILEGRRASSSAPEPLQEEAAQYLEALTSDRIFTEAISIGAQESYPEILEKAIVVEKNSVFFYTAVKDILSSKMEAKDVDRLIAEEIGHFHSLTDALRIRRERNGGA